jgi:hypothetical protein
MKIFGDSCPCFCDTTSASWLESGDIHLSDCFIVGQRQLPPSRLLATHADDSHGWHLLRDGFAIWLLKVAESGLDRLRQLCSRKQIAL